MTSDLETRLRRYGETFERFVDADADIVDVSLTRARRSRPRRLAAHRAPVPTFSIVPADELVRQRVTRRAPVVAAIAACLAVALVVGAWLLISGNHAPSVRTPAGPPKTVPRWTITPVPQKGHNHQIPVGVSCSDATHCIAPRGYGDGPGGIETLSDGVWSVTPGPNHVAGTGGLTGVSCSDATHCVAVGSIGSETRSQTLIQTLSGGTWSGTPSPNVSPGINVLNGVSCSDATHCVAVGQSGGHPAAGGRSRFTESQTLIETLAGGTWSVTPTPVDGSLLAVSCSDAAHCVAVGSSNDGTGAQTLIETLAGGTWSVTPSPNQGFNNILFAVSCSDVAHCVAVGDSNDGIKAWTTLIETLSGGTWSVTPSPSHGAHDGGLNGVSCADAAHCVAVGTSNDGTRSRPLIETLSRGTWSVTPSPTHGAHDSVLIGVSCPDATHCVAVGAFQATASASGGQTLIETFPAPARHQHRHRS